MKKLTLSALIASTLMSTSVWAENLIDVFNLSLENDPQLLAEAASRQATGELKDQARANFLPQIGLTADTNRLWVDSSSDSFERDYDSNQHGYSLSLTQSIYQRENFVQNKQAVIAIEGADASYTAAEQGLVVRVAERYFAVLGAQADLTLALAQREAIAKQLEQTQQQFDVGMATITDTAESQAAYDLANATVITAENEVDNTKEELREVAGQYFNNLADLHLESPLVKPEPENIDSWSQTALDSNPSLQVAKSDVETARQNIELQKSGHYPSLNLVAQTGYDSQSRSSLSTNLRTHTDMIGLEFNLPIYTGGDVSSRTRQAGYQLDQAMQIEEAQRRAVTRQTRQSFNGVMDGISQVNALKQAVLSNEKALESTEAGYEVGTRTTVDVLNSRQNLFSARRDYIRARYNYILNSLRLKQAAGIVSVEDLYRINNWLEG